MGNCCKKKEKEWVYEETPTDDSTFNDSDGNTYVWDDENRQGFTCIDTGRHFTQDNIKPNIYWDDEDPQMVLDVSEFVEQQADEGVEEPAEYAEEGGEYAEEEYQGEGAEGGYVSTTGTGYYQEEGVEGASKVQQGYEAVGTEEEAYEPSVTKKVKGASQFQGGYEDVGTEEEPYEPSVAPVPKTRGRSRTLGPRRRIGGRSAVPKRGRRSKRSKVSPKSQKTAKRPLSKRSRKRTRAPSSRQPLKRGLIGAKRSTRQISRRPKSSTKRARKRAKSKSVKSRKSSKARPRKRAG